MEVLICVNHPGHHPTNYYYINHADILVACGLLCTHGCEIGNCCAHNSTIVLLEKKIILGVAHVSVQKLYICLCFIIFFQQHPASAVAGVGKKSRQGHHPGVILPLQWADAIILASSCQPWDKKSQILDFDVLQLLAAPSSDALG